MTRDKQRLVDYLQHICEAIARIERYTQGMGEAAFLSNQLIQDAVVRNFEIIGEASINGGGTDRQDLVLDDRDKIEMTVPFHRVDQHRDQHLQPLAANTVGGLPQNVSACRVASS
jgi:uncharacterized protein with HEPN domain